MSEYCPKCRGLLEDIGRVRWNGICKDDRHAKPTFAQRIVIAIMDKTDGEWGYIAFTGFDDGIFNKFASVIQEEIDKEQTR